MVCPDIAGVTVGCVFQMKIEIPVNLVQYRVYDEQPLCEVELELSDTAKTNYIKYITSTVEKGIRAPPVTLEPVPNVELPLYVMINIKHCDNGPGLHIKFNLKETPIRARSLGLGYGGLCTFDDVKAMANGEFSLIHFATCIVISENQY